MSDGHTGFAIYRASRLEALLPPLIGLLDAAPPAAVLAPQTVIAAHPGMRYWLSGALARARGPAGIAANLDILLPSHWLDRLAQGALGQGAVALSAWRRENLRWRIHALLDAVADARLAAYLDGEQPARRRFQLADRLAALYARHSLYRPDWLAAWARGASAGFDAGFLAPLWRRLRSEIGLPHRGELMQRLAQVLAEEPALAGGEEPLHLFGLSHIPPIELAVLRAVARHRLVALYLPDPCREHWAGLVGDRGLLRQAVAGDAFDEEAESLFLDQGHPLLAAWGRMGQHFLLALDEGETRFDHRHVEDVGEAQASPDRLGRLQQSLRELRPQRLACDLSDPAGLARERAERSLRVHACHTRLRELEVLREVLLRELAEQPDLMPSDIVVMAPDIQAYLPLLPAVFGPPGRADADLPYHLADVPAAEGDALQRGFLRLLDLPGLRLTAAEVLDLLTLPEAMARLGLAPAEVDLVGAWLAEARVAWGLDAEDRVRSGAPPIEEHTLAWGLDRLLAGYVAGGGEDAVLALPDSVELAPLAGIAGPQAELLGAFERFLAELAALRADAARARPASAWSALLLRSFEALFRIDPTDRAAREGEARIRRALATLAAEPGEAGLDPQLDYAVVRDWLRQHLTGDPDQQAFLLGGITVCGMVPQRAIPFAVIAVLGLNEGEYPRPAREAGLDPMARPGLRRLGDREVRSDDRYLFLETVMAARRVLHLSYLGEGVSDGLPRNPAAPLAELLAELARHAQRPAKDEDSSDWPWLVRHPLQPFDARYFDGADVRLYSHNAALAQLPGLPTRPAPRFAPRAGGGAAPRPAELSLRELQAYFRNPARQVLQARLGLRLDALAEDRLLEEEPLQARFEALDGVSRRLFLQALAEGGLPADPPPWLRLTGLLPPGRVGIAAWVATCAEIEPLLQAAQEHPALAGGLPEPLPLRVEAEIAGTRLLGELGRVFRRDDTLWVFDVFPRARSEAELRLDQRIGLFLDWALLRLDPASKQCAVRLCVPVAKGDTPWQDALAAFDARFARDAEAARGELERRLAGLIAHFAEAQVFPGAYFPRSSTAALRGQAVEAAWLGGERQVGERDYGEGQARLLGEGLDLSPDSPDLARLQAAAIALQALIAFDASAEAAA